MKYNNITTEKFVNFLQTCNSEMIVVIKIKQKSCLCIELDHVY
jgi:hypothetical protein